MCEYWREKRNNSKDGSLHIMLSMQYQLRYSLSREGLNMYRDPVQNQGIGFQNRNEARSKCYIYS